MSVKLLCLCLLLVVLCPSWAEEQTCLISASNCEECIQSGPSCAWCTAPRANIRCHTLKGLLRAGCNESYVYNPQSRLQVVKNDSSIETTNAKTVFLQPQELSLHLRPGVSQSFPLTITTPTDRPITELTMDISAVPNGVNVTLTSIVNGNPIVVQVNVEAVQCPSETHDSNQTFITPRGLPQSVGPLSVKLKITLECQCDCTRNREENSLACSGHGALVCGQCECYEPYDGQQCETDTDLFFSRSADYCRSGPDAPLCSGRGDCVRGYCECQKRVNPEERYSGQYCQCSNFDCPHANGRLCGGHGKCECGRCICNSNWTDEDCSCTLDTASCMAKNGQLCNGRGSCVCGTCICTPEFVGATCEDCTTCPGVCSKHSECVQCRAFGKGANKTRCDQECGHVTVTMVETTADLPETVENVSHCIMRDADDCHFYYAFTYTPSGGQLTVVKAKGCPMPYLHFI